MTKPARFSRRIDAWMSEPLADACEMVAAHQAITASAVIRQALQFYLAQIGVPIAPPTQVNGQHRQAAE